MSKCNVKKREGGVCYVLLILETRYVLGAEGAPATKGKPQPNKPSISFIDAQGKE